MRKSQIWVAYYQISRADNEAKLHMISYWPSNGSNSVPYVCMYLYILFLPSSSLCHLETTITKFGFNGTPIPPILVTAIGQERGTNYTIRRYTRIIRLPRGMRLEMRQSTSVPASSGWHLFSKKAQRQLSQCCLLKCGHPLSTRQRNTFGLCSSLLLQRLGIAGASIIDI